jgi:hypothetical protein
MQARKEHAELSFVMQAFSVACIELASAPAATVTPARAGSCKTKVHTFTESRPRFAVSFFAAPAPANIPPYSLSLALNVGCVKILFSLMPPSYMYEQGINIPLLTGAWPPYRRAATPSLASSLLDFST